MIPNYIHSIKPFQIDITETLQFKYLLDIDGNSVSWTRLPFIMAAGSVALKVDSDFSQYFYGAIKPYRDYVPVKDDMSDLVDQVLWLKQNDQIAREIQENG